MSVLGVSRSLGKACVRECGARVCVCIFVGIHMCSHFNVYKPLCDVFHGKDAINEVLLLHLSFMCVMPLSLHLCILLLKQCV